MIAFLSAGITLALDCTTCPLKVALYKMVQQAESIMKNLRTMGTLSDTIR